MFKQNAKKKVFNKDNIIIIIIILFFLSYFSLSDIVVNSEMYLHWKQRKPYILNLTFIELKIMELNF